MKTSSQIALILSLFLLGCSQNIGSNDFFRPDWTGIDTAKMELKVGQVIKFEIDSQQVSAIVLDFDSDEGGVWYGMCLLNNNNLFGRQIPSGLMGADCVDLLDMTYLNHNDMEQYETVGYLNIDIKKVGIGSISPVSNYSEIFSSFTFGLKQRKKKQTPCGEGLADVNAVRECYFDIEKIVKN